MITFYDHHNSTLSPYPSVAWGSRKNERWDSKIHYDAGNGKTVCGIRIPRNTPPANDPVDVCENCIKATESGLTKRAPDVARAAAKCTCPLHPVMLSAQCPIHGTTPRG